MKGDAAHTVESHFVRRASVVREIYDVILQVASKFGPVEEDPKKTSIHLNRRTAFAGIATRKDSLILTLKSREDIEHPRIRITMRASANRWYLEIRLQSPNEVDKQLIEWLRASYDLSA